jgi:hypothetical protein
MDDPTTTATLDQADEDILTYTASDDALEAAAGTERGEVRFFTRTRDSITRCGGSCFDSW